MGNLRPSEGKGGPQGHPACQDPCATVPADPCFSALRLGGFLIFVPAWQGNGESGLGQVASVQIQTLPLADNVALGKSF